MTRRLLAFAEFEQHLHLLVESVLGPESGRGGELAREHLGADAGVGEQVADLAGLLPRQGVEDAGP